MVSKNRSREGRSKRGFAAMDPEARRVISKRGGEASHESGRGHEFNSEEAREAGRRGGAARWGTRASRQGIPEEEIGHSTFRASGAEDVDRLVHRELGRRGSSAGTPGPKPQREIARRGDETSGRSRGSRAR